MTTDGDGRYFKSINKSFRITNRQISLLGKIVEEKGKNVSYWVRKGIDLIIKEENLDVF